MIIRFFIVWIILHIILFFVERYRYKHSNFDATELYDYENDKPLAKAGDKVKVVFIKDK